MEDGEGAVKEEEKPKIHPSRRNIGLASILQDMKASGQLEDKGPRWSGRANDLKDDHDRERVLEASGVIEVQDGGGPSSETRKFNFKLDKYDEFGRTLTPKEAFRELCWKFHGKAPGAKAKRSKTRCEVAIATKLAAQLNECKRFKKQPVIHSWCCLGRLVKDRDETQSRSTSTST